MDPRRKPDRKIETEPVANDDEADGGTAEPSLAASDWDALAAGELTFESVPENGDIRYDDDLAENPLGEDDDNAYQESDQALPDDQEEKTIARNPSKEGSRFDET